MVLMLRDPEKDFKVACQSCVGGHRAPSCTHIDRPLVRVPVPGRPRKEGDRNSNSPNAGFKAFIILDGQRGTQSQDSKEIYFSQGQYQRLSSEEHERLVTDRKQKLEEKSKKRSHSADDAEKPAKRARKTVTQPEATSSGSNEDDDDDDDEDAAEEQDLRRQQSENEAWGLQLEQWHQQQQGQQEPGQPELLLQQPHQQPQPEEWPLNGHNFGFPFYQPAQVQQPYFQQPQPQPQPPLSQQLSQSQSQPQPQPQLQLLPVRLDMGNYCPADDTPSWLNDAMLREQQADAPAFINYNNNSSNDLAASGPPSQTVSPVDLLQPGTAQEAAQIVEEEGRQGGQTGFEEGADENVLPIMDFTDEEWAAILTAELEKESGKQ